MPRCSTSRKNAAAVIAGRVWVGSSRDWAAKGPRLLGIKRGDRRVVPEHIHRSNLIGMGILRGFHRGVTRKTLGLTGEGD